MTAPPLVVIAASEICGRDAMMVPSSTLMSALPTHTVAAQRSLMTVASSEKTFRLLSTSPAANEFQSADNVTRGEGPGPLMTVVAVCGGLVVTVAELSVPLVGVTDLLPAPDAGALRLALGDGGSARAGDTAPGPAIDTKRTRLPARVAIERSLCSTLTGD